MSLKRELIRLLDRPGGRRLLGWAATCRARHLTDLEIRIFYDGMWLHRVDGYAFPDGPSFNYYYTHVSDDWANQLQTYLANAADYWYQHYLPKPGDVIVDVGAGQGEDVLAFSQDVGETGKVIAIEAFPQSYRSLEAFCRLNQLTNVVPLHVAIMDRPGSVLIGESADWEANAVVMDSAHEGIRVPATTLDRLYTDLHLDEIAFLKMNIEGAEKFALPGMAAAVKNVRAICVACHDFRDAGGDGEQFRTRAFVEEFLAAHGFKLASRPDDPRPYVRDHVFGYREN